VGFLTRSLVALSLFCGLTPARLALADLGLVIGQPQTAIIQPQDTLLDIAFRRGLGFQEVMRLNPGVDVWVPKVGTRVLLPTQLIVPDVPHEGLVVNIPEMRLYDFSVGDTPEVFAIAIGDPVDPSPVGEYRVGEKRIDPTWSVPTSIRLQRPELPQTVPPGPDNPLGQHWMTLGQTSYGIHGTDNVWSIGRMATHGCIRLYNREMQRLFGRVPEGTRVRVIYETVKIGRHGNELMVEVHPDIYARGDDTFVRTLVRLFVLGLLDDVDREELKRIIEEARGVPVRIGSLEPPRES
jgi:L,D-transpeptidase ErfK/SrfK